MSSAPPPCVLTIAGSDSGAGAGVQADARTIHACGGFACMAITAITAQNTRGVQAWWPEKPAAIAGQMKAVLGVVGPGPSARTDSGALPIRAAKTGLLPGAAAVRAVATVISAHAGLPLVVDPVIGSTSGTIFLDAVGMKALRRYLLPLATLVTPNWPEAEALSGLSLRTFADAEIAAKAIVETCGCAVLLKGGHAPGNVCRDCLVTKEGAVHWFENPRLATPNTHGTGCVLSAAIATGLARGQPPLRAVEHARDFLQRSLKQHRRDRWGGAGPAFPGQQ